MKFESLALVVALLAGALPVAQADREVFDVSNPVYRDECGSCHLPYPPQLLPKTSWLRSTRLWVARSRSIRQTIRGRLN